MEKEIKQLQEIKFIIDGDLYDERKHILNAIIISLNKISFSLENFSYNSKRNYLFNYEIDRICEMLSSLKMIDYKEN